MAEFEAGGSYFLVVPDALYDAIQKRLDVVIAEYPDAEKDCDALYHQLLDAFNRYGFIPEFSIEKKEPSQ